MKGSKIGFVPTEREMFRFACMIAWSLSIRVNGKFDILTVGDLSICGEIAKKHDFELSDDEFIKGRVVIDERSAWFDAEQYAKQVTEYNSVLL